MIMYDHKIFEGVPNTTENDTCVIFGTIKVKSEEYIHKKTSSTGKTVEKRELETGQVLGIWETIAKAAQYEGVCTSKMSRCIKNKITIKDYYYAVNGAATGTAATYM